MKTWKMRKKENLKKYLSKAKEYCSCHENRAKQYFCQRFHHLANCIDDLEDANTSLVILGVDARLEIEFEILDTLIFMIEEFDAPYADSNLLDRILQIIDWRISLLGNTTADEIIKQELDIIMSEIIRESKLSK